MACQPRDSAERWGGKAFSGSCVSAGYAEAAGTKSLTVPILGTITIALFKKAAVEVAVTAEASRTEAVEPAGADEEVDEIGRPLRPVPMARGAAPRRQFAHVRLCASIA